MDCTRFMRSIDDYLEDRLEGDDRRAFRGHLQTCSECRAKAAVLEPSFLLAAGAPPEFDDRAASECAEAVTALIRQERLRSRLAPRSRSWLAAAAMCVIVLGGVCCGASLPGALMLRRRWSRRLIQKNRSRSLCHPRGLKFKCRNPKSGSINLPGPTVKRRRCTLSSTKTWSCDEVQRRTWGLRACVGHDLGSGLFGIYCPCGTRRPERCRRQGLQGGTCQGG